ncbi:N-acetylglucosamine kinase [Niastella caeni]|uniref:N-acetylglucosamine kinase n=1 Tax=Niastella caeni TaxID=2569763 RepID=A0A4S8I0E8_9BACT|nr:N-acetylglucosamine kinase [Niastella caeni]THU39944.1 N-acetylglucosamine kinase [Niastella caeni]
MAILLADSGATKCEWCLAGSKESTKTVFTQGISPYFFNEEKTIALLQQELLPNLQENTVIEQIHYYGTGMRNPGNVSMVKKALESVFKGAEVKVNDDMLSAARALNGRNEGLACNLGTGSFVVYYDGEQVSKQAPGIGYILGDEGSGAYLGKKVLQYYLYNTFDEELRFKFENRYNTTTVDIFENVYRKPLANRYLASFCLFLSENRGHYMIENIIEDGLNDFFFTHLCKFTESWRLPIHFVGGVSFAFSDIIKELCHSYEFELGNILKTPMAGLVQYHV